MQFNRVSGLMAANNIPRPFIITPFFFPLPYLPLYCFPFNFTEKTRAARVSGLNVIDWKKPRVLSHVSNSHERCMNWLSGRYAVSDIPFDSFARSSDIELGYGVDESA